MNKKEKVQRREYKEERKEKKLRISFDLLKRSHSGHCLAPKACGDHE
jgi:hypothetical protein